MKISVITPFYKGNEYMPAYWRMILENAGKMKSEMEVLLVNDSPGTEPDLSGLLENCPDAVITVPGRNPSELPDGESNDGLPHGNNSRSYVLSQSISLEEIGLTVYILTNLKNSGIQRARIHGLEAASGEWVILLDQDDLLREDALQCFSERISEDEMVLGRAKTEKASVREDGSTLKDSCENSDGGKTRAKYLYVANAVLEQENWKSLWYRKDYHKRLVGDKKTYLTVGTQIISPGQCLIPKNLIPEFWMQHPLMANGSDDYFLWILLLEAGVEFRYVDEPLYVHHYTAKNLSGDTTVTDASTYEFIDLLRGSILDSGKAEIPEGSLNSADSADSTMSIGQGLTIGRKQTLKDLDTLEWMMRFKADFRKAKGAGKLKVASQHPALMMDNLIYKIRTGTGYGFNR